MYRLINYKCKRVRVDRLLEFTDFLLILFKSISILCSTPHIIRIMYMYLKIYITYYARVVQIILFLNLSSELTYCIVRTSIFYRLLTSHHGLKNLWFTFLDFYKYLMSVHSFIGISLKFQNSASSERCWYTTGIHRRN